MVDYLAEIPLPGRILAPKTKNLAREAAATSLPSFVAGPENRLVASTVNRLMSHASLSETCPHVVASLRDARFQPPLISLFGPSGAGKTHLAHGLVRHWQNAHGEAAAQYTTAADFRRDFHDAMTGGRVTEFRDACRTRRLLVIDDIHRLPNDGYLMLELRHAIDAIEENGGTMLVTSLHPPEALSNMPPDIRSRLASGLSLQLAEPGSEARVRIIRHASIALGRELAPHVASRLADSTTGTATQVFGAVFELWASPAASDTSDSARTEKFLAARTSRQPSLPEIMAVVARYMSLPQKQLKSASRRQSIVHARAIVIYLARQLTSASYKHIGRALGGRDHTTVMHSYRKIERERATNVATQQALEDLRRLLACG